VYREQEDRADERLELPTEEVTDFIQQHMNHFPGLEEAAESFSERSGLPSGGRFAAMTEWLRGRGIDVIGSAAHAVVRRYDPARKRITISETLPRHSRTFQLAAQVALIEYGELLDRLCEDAHLTSESSRGLGRVVLANYFAGAVLMPYRAFLDAAIGERYDVELLAHRFGAGFEQVCHRLTTLRRAGAEGVPFHMIRVDLAGNISKRFSASGIRFARFSGACPRWNVFSAFQTPGRVRVQISRMSDGALYFCAARSVPKARGGYHAPHTVQAVGLGCRIEYARELVYSDGIDLERLERAVPVGVTCRLCDRDDCEQRTLPSLRTRLVVDENVRGISFFTPVD
jgi:predicted transcriptional regulator